MTEIPTNINMVKPPAPQRALVPQATGELLKSASVTGEQNTITFPSHGEGKGVSSEMQQKPEPLRLLDTFGDAVTYAIGKPSPHLDSGLGKKYVETLLAQGDILANALLSSDPITIHEAIQRLYWINNTANENGGTVIVGTEVVDWQGMQEYTQFFLDANIGAISATLISENNPSICLDAFNYIAMIAESSNFTETQKQHIMTSLLNNLEYSLVTVNDADDFNKAVVLLKRLQEIIPREVMDEKVALLVVAQDRRTQLAGRNMFALLGAYDVDPRFHDNTDGPRRNFYNDILLPMETTLIEYGFRDVPLSQIWLDNTSSDFQQSFSWRMKNIVAMNSLEAQMPGICKVLYDEFGICNFARFPTEILIRQYLEQDDTSIPCGVTVLPLYDHNEAFNQNQFNATYLQPSLGDAYKQRYVEVGNKRDLARRLLQAHRRYGELAFLVLGGHGSPDGIELGYKLGDSNSLNSTRRIAIEDLDDARLVKLSRILRSDATIILESCSTGKEVDGKEPIGQKISRFGFKVIAPEADGHMSHLEASIDGATLSLAADYADEHFQKVSTSIYINGEKQR